MMVHGWWTFYLFVGHSMGFPKPDSLHVPDNVWGVKGHHDISLNRNVMFWVSFKAYQRTERTPILSQHSILDIYILTYIPPLPTSFVLFFLFHQTMQFFLSFFLPSLLSHLISSIHQHTHTSGQYIYIYIYTVQYCFLPLLTLIINWTKTKFPFK